MTATAEQVHQAGKSRVLIKGLYIGGAWQQASDGGTTSVRCPADGHEVAVVASSTVEDAERAIASARATFDGGPWRRLTDIERGTVLLRVADLLERDKAAYARGNRPRDMPKRFHQFAEPGGRKRPNRNDPPAAGAHGTHARVREYEWQHTRDDSAHANKKALHRVARGTLPLRQLIADECPERFHRDVDAGIKDPQQAGGYPQHR